MQWRIIIIGKDLKFCKQLKYDLQDDTLQCYYALSLDDGLRHLIHYPYRLVVLESLSISADTLNHVAQIRNIHCQSLLHLRRGLKSSEAIPCGQSQGKQLHRGRDCGAERYQKPQQYTHRHGD